LTCLTGFSQKFPEKGVPLLKNYTPPQYNEQGKIWDITSADNGIVYMAADKGLLEYDGKTWESYKGSTGFTRSILVLNDSVIYTGSDLDFGVWKKNKYQAFEYTSLYPFVKDLNETYEEFWAVHHVDDNILFISFQNIYVYKNEQLTRIPAPNRFSGSFFINNTLYIADNEDGLYSITGLTLNQLFLFPANLDFQVAGLYLSKNRLVIVTRNYGLFSYESGILAELKNQLSEKLKTVKVFSFEQIDENHFAYGTVLGGLFIADSEGRIIHHINKQKGLPNNTILSLHHSENGKLWIGMDYGIASLNHKDDVTYFIDYRGDYGTGSSAIVKDSVFFLGTNQGLYRSGWSELNNDSEFYKFTVIPGTEGQVWTLANIENTLLMGHDRGLFSIEGAKVRKLSDQPGVWTIIPYKGYLLTGNYNGITIYKKGDTGWEFLKRMELILGACRQLIHEQDDVLWVNIPNYGIIRAVLDNNLYPVERLIFPEHDFQGSNPSLILDTTGLKVVTERFEYLYDTVNRIFIKETEKIIQPRVEGVLSGVYFYSPLNSDYGFYPVYNGFALKYLSMDDEDHPRRGNLILRNIEAFNNNEKVNYFPGARIPYRLHNLRIEFIVPNQDDVMYQYRLNESDDWSLLDSENSFTFLSLKEGEYTLSVRAGINGIITDTTQFSVLISPPWYRSWYAYIFYFLLALLIAYIIILWRNSALKKQHEEFLVKEKEALRRQSEQYEQEIIRMEQEKLQSEYNQLKQELRSKTIDLANKAKENEDKNRLLLTMKEKCDTAQKDQSESSGFWHEMQKMIDSYLNAEDKTFEIQMDELHQDLFIKLKEQFPGLSSNDLRLCAYLKIGLNSKEIADLMNIQPSSAYISRSRLRKKLNLKANEDLHDFLFNL
jgi:hypothetical protein